MFNLCEDTDLYKLDIVINNPSSATANLKSFTLNIKNKLTDVLLISSVIPPLELKSGDNYISFEALATIEDEYHCNEILLIFFINFKKI